VRLSTYGDSPPAANLGLTVVDDNKVILELLLLGSCDRVYCDSKGEAASSMRDVVISGSGDADDTM
jgi:hypothetical protein